MSADASKALKLSADISLHAVSCPGVWLPNKGRCSLSLCLLGFHTRTNFLPPTFPVLFHEKFRFDRTFLGVRSLGALETVLERETVYLELVQEEGGGGGGEAVLAVFECSVRELLFPAPSRRNSYSGMDLDLLMEPTRDFPGIISPKVEVSTRSTVRETRSPLHECQTDNVSFGHTSDAGTKGTYHLTAAPTDGEADEGATSERREADQTRPRAAAPARSAGLTSRHRSRSEGNLTDIQYGQLSSRYGGSRSSLVPRPSARAARLDEAHDATVSDLGPEVCQHCEGSHSSQSCTTCRMYSQYFPHSPTSPHPRRVLYQPRCTGGGPRSRTRRRYLMDDLTWRALPSGARLQRPSSAPPTGRRTTPPAESRSPPAQQQQQQTQEDANREGGGDEEDLEPEDDEASRREPRTPDIGCPSPSSRLARRPEQRLSNLYSHYWDDSPDCCCFCCDPPSLTGLSWYRPYYDRPYNRPYYRIPYHDYAWPLRGQPPWYPRYRC